MVGRFAWDIRLSHYLYRRTLSGKEKGDYIAAVKCLQSRPSQDPAVPAAKSRFDEFQAYHIEQSDNGIHVTVRILWIYYRLPRSW